MMAPDGCAIWWIEEGFFFKEEFAEFRESVLAWLRSLDLDPDRLAPRAAITRIDGKYELHVDEVLRGGPKGYDRCDPMDQDSLLKVRRIVIVEPDSWPAMPAVVAA